MQNFDWGAAFLLKNPFYFASFQTNNSSTKYTGRLDVFQQNFFHKSALVLSACVHWKWIFRFVYIQMNCENDNDDNTYHLNVRNAFLLRRVLKLHRCHFDNDTQTSSQKAKLQLL